MKDFLRNEKNKLVLVKIKEPIDFITEFIGSRKAIREVLEEINIPANDVHRTYIETRNENFFEYKVDQRKNYTTVSNISWTIPFNIEYKNETKAIYIELFFKENIILETRELSVENEEEQIEEMIYWYIEDHIGSDKEILENLLDMNN